MCHAITANETIELLRQGYRLINRAYRWRVEVGQTRKRLGLLPCVEMEKLESSGAVRIELYDGWAEAFLN